MYKRRQILQLYKELYFMGRDYPLGSKYFNEKLKNAFLKKRDLKDPKEIDKAIEFGEYIKKELEALYFLKKYRSIKRTYYD